MKDVSTLKDLMVMHLQSLYDAENQWSEQLKESAFSINSSDLKKIFATGSMSAAGHAETIKKILTGLRKENLVKKNMIVQGLVREIRELKDMAADPEVFEAALIVTHQCVNHYLIAKYGSVSSFARMLQEEAIAAQLHRILEEEKTEDESLTRLAEGSINIKAKSALIH